MSIVTRTGDGGETGLPGGSRIQKSDVRLHATGTVDELNAFVGVVLAGALPDDIRVHLTRLQHLLFRLGADIASPATVRDTKRIESAHVREVEEWIEVIEPTLPVLTHFILPGGEKAAAQLHIARTVCRRAERWAVALSEFEKVNKDALIFLNRLSDYFFLAARKANHASDEQEVRIEY